MNSGLSLDEISVKEASCLIASIIFIRENIQMHFLEWPKFFSICKFF